MTSLIEKFAKSMKGARLTKQEGSFGPLLLLTGFTGGLCSPVWFETFRTDFKAILYGFGPGKGFILFDEIAYRENTKEVYEEFIKQPRGHVPKCLQLWDKSVKEMVALYQASHPEKLKKMSEDELLDLIAKASKLYADARYTVFVESFDEKTGKEFYKQANGNEDFKDFFNYTTLRGFDSFNMRQNRAILAELAKKQPDPYPLQYCFSDYLEAPLKRAEDALKESNTENMRKELKTQEEHIIDNRKKRDNFTTKLSPELKKLADFIGMVMEVRDSRKEGMGRVMSILYNAAKEVFERTGLPAEECSYAYYTDFSSGEYKKPDYASLLEKRKSGCRFLSPSKGKHEWEFGNYEEFRKKAMELIEAKSEVQELKGQIGSKGHAKGIVNIILSSADFSKFKEGQILVTSMTRPEFVPILKKAAAIVTDEGGITCHAAIVSRELKIPCVIGTKNATTVLKDGDVVDVDAEKGIVRKI